ncbi:MBL fold metallo-hydrolase [Xanthobacter sp. VNH20]|uniref:MBL fold metallo-hydrolase n=1 Tax=Xanthobacter sp. VNH20 TaxID=3156616 RepID=UPI0032B31A63
MRQMAALLGAILLFAFPSGSKARAAEPPEKCPRMVAQDLPWKSAPRVWQAAFREMADAKRADEGRQVRLTFVGHSTFLIESPAGVTIATDYNDYVRPDVVPMIATMNRAHDTHYTNHPDPGIAYVLRGWGENGQPAHYDLTVEDVWIRNVPTNIRHGVGTDYDANSMFVFEVAGLCIAHLGHLHHVLTPDHLEALGRIDVVLAPVDGSYTLDIEGMKETLKAINAPLVIPMHYFSAWGLDNFLSRLGNDYVITRQASPSVTLSRETLPAKPTVLVLPGR